jgi:uncharacterized membrane protein
MLKGGRVTQEITFFGMRYIIPMVEEWPRTVIAVNVGGAVIPALLSFYLLLKNGMYGRSFIGVAIVAAIVHGLARPVKGVGIAVPTFVPPLVAASTALLLSRRSAPALAYIAGSLGDLDWCGPLEPRQDPWARRPRRLHRRGGTFDGIFLTGILAVLLA